MNCHGQQGGYGRARGSKKIQGAGGGFGVGDRSGSRRRVTRTCSGPFRRRSPADSPVGPSAPPGSHTAPPAKGGDSRGSRFMEGAKRGSRRRGVTRTRVCTQTVGGQRGEAG